MAKAYNGITGVDGFLYMMHGEGEVQSTTPEAIKFLQEIELEMEEEIVRAYGDNVTAELAKSVGNVTLTSSFHRLPLEDKAKLFGLKVQDGLTFAGGNNGVAYAACMFARTTENGKEYVGLFKGMFKMSNIEGATKEDEIEFQSEESEAEFMPVEVEGVEGVQSFVLGYDANGSTTNRDKIYQLVFGVEHPDATPEGGA